MGLQSFGAVLVYLDLEKQLVYARLGAAGFGPTSLRNLLEAALAADRR